MAENIVGLGKLGKKLDAIAAPKEKRRYLRGIGKEAVSEARRDVAVKTGTTKRRIRVAKVTTSSVRVTAAGAGVFLEGGVVPHVIKPKGGKALAFASQSATTARFGEGATLKRTKSGKLTKGTTRKYGAGAFMVVRGVRHPGMKAQPFLRRAVLRSVSGADLARQIEQTWARS